MEVGGHDSGLVRVQLLGLPVQARLRFSQHLQDLTRELSLVQIGAERRPGPALPPRLLAIAAELNGPYAAFRAAPDAVVHEALLAGKDHCDVTYVVPPSAGPFLRRLGEVLEEADEFCRGRAEMLLLPASQEVVAYRQWIVAECSRQLAGEAPRPWRVPASPDEGAEGAEGRRGTGMAVVPGVPLPRPWTGAGAAGDLAQDVAQEDVAQEDVAQEDVAQEDVAHEGVVRQPLVMESAASSVAAPRRYVREVLRELGASDLEESAELGVSELVTNAVLHAGSAFTVAVRQVRGGRIRIEVIDTSPLPLQARPSALTATTGRGLQLVEDLSVDWGVEGPAAGGPGKTVWFEPRGTDAGESATVRDWSLDLDALL